MSLADPIVLKDNAGVDTTFGIQQVIAAATAGDPSGTIRVDAASDVSQPRTLTIKHQVTGKGSSRVLRSLLSVSEDVTTETGTSSRMVFSASWVFPLNGSFIADDLKHNIAIIGDLLFTTGSLAVDGTKVTALLQRQS